MPSTDDVPFDLDGTESDTQDEVEAIFDLFGYTSWRDVFANWEDEDHSHWRTKRYETPEEALKELYDRKLLAFSKIVYYHDNPLPYGIVVGTST